MSNHTRRSFLRNTVFGVAGAAGHAGFGDALRRPTDSWRWPRDLERRRLGKTDMDVAILGFGGSEIGYQRTEQATVAKLLNSALDAGLNAIDTAECYLASEELIGKAVAHRRKDYWLFTKVGHWPADGWTGASIAKSIERSLQRLQTDHVDVVHLHSCGKDVLERGDAIEALEKAKKEGKTRYVGYSGDREDALFAVESGKFDTLQTSINLFDQQAIELFLPKAREKDIGVICKRPIGNAVWRHDTQPETGYVVEYWKRMQKLDYDFCKGDQQTDRGPDGAGGIALRFTLSLPGVHTAIVGTSNPERFGQNAELLAAGPLPATTIESIRARWKEVAEASWVGQT